MALVEEIIHEVPGVAHTVATSGMSFIAQTNSSNFGSMFVVLKPFDERRRNPALGAEAIMAKLRKEFARRVKDARVVVYNSSPVPGLGTAGGFKVIVEDRGDLGLDVLQSQTDDLVRKLQARARARLRHNPVPLEVAAIVSRHRPHQDRSPGSDIQRRQSDTLDVSGVALCQQLQRIRPTLASHHPGGRESTATRSKISTCYRCATNMARWCRSVLSSTCVRPSGRSRVTRYNLYTSAAVTGSMTHGRRLGRRDRGDQSRLLRKSTAFDEGRSSQS